MLGGPAVGLKASANELYVSGSSAGLPAIRLISLSTSAARSSSTCSSYGRIASGISSRSMVPLLFVSMTRKTFSADPCTATFSASTFITSGTESEMGWSNWTSSVPASSVRCCFVRLAARLTCGSGFVQKKRSRGQWSCRKLRKNSLMPSVPEPSLSERSKSVSASLSVSPQFIDLIALRNSIWSSSPEPSTSALRKALRICSSGRRPKKSVMTCTAYSCAPDIVVVFTIDLRLSRDATPTVDGRLGCSGRCDTLTSEGGVSPDLGRGRCCARRCAGS